MSRCLAMSELHEPDVELVGRIRAADAAAWEELIERFQGRLLAFAGNTRGSLADERRYRPGNVRRVSHQYAQL